MAVSTGMLFCRGTNPPYNGYVWDLYITDTANAFDQFDTGSGAGASSGDEKVIPEDMHITGYNQVAATGQTRTRVNVNDKDTEICWRNSQFIPSATIIGTPYLGIFLKAGSRLKLKAIA